MRLILKIHNDNSNVPSMRQQMQIALIMTATLLEYSLSMF
jgi:hypothetical protein